MADIAEAFEQHLRSLSDADWNALVTRVRASEPQDDPPPKDQAEGLARGRELYKQTHKGFETEGAQRHVKGAWS